jgi:hypothetical protein
MFQFKKFTATAKTITQLPLDTLAKAQDKITKDDLKIFSQMSKSNLPQALAIINQMPLERGTNGLFNFKDTRELWKRALIEGRILWEGQPIDPKWFIGLRMILNRNPRGDILGSGIRQSSEEGSRFSAPVPLILSAFKQYRNIGYEEWDYQAIEGDELDWFMDKDCQQIVQYRGADLGVWSLEELLEFRERANPNQKPLYQVTTATRIEDPKFKELPRIIKLLVLQLWVFHNSIRHPLAITSLSNFDEPATPLVDSEVPVKTAKPDETPEDIWSL